MSVAQREAVRRPWLPLGAVLAVLAALAGCGGGAALGDGQGFVAAEAHSLPVAAAAGGEVSDPTSAQRFLFPEGGTGTLRLTRLSGTPAAPAQGEGWRIEYDGAQPLELVIDGAVDGSAATWPTVYAWSELGPAAVDDGRSGPRWVPVPQRTLPGGRVAFELSARTAPAMASAAAGVPQAATAVARDFWISKLDKNSTVVDRRVARGLQATDYIERYAAELPTDIAATFRANAARRPLTWSEDGNWYKGFSYLPFRRNNPRIAVSLDMFQLAHELSHYLTHMTVGDDIYEQLEGQKYPEKHGLLDNAGRNKINEDLAYFIEFFLQGKGANIDLFENGPITMRDRKPGVDVPAHEGFTALMLASLVRPTTQVVSLDRPGFTVDVPTVGLTYRDVFRIIARGARDVDTLRRHIEERLDPDGRARWRINLQRLGWRYWAGLRVVDNAGLPIGNAEVRIVSRAGGSEYSAEAGITSADGTMSLFFLYPGDSTIVVKRGGETLEGRITIDPDRPTHQRITLGDVQVVPLEQFPTLREVCASFRYTTITAVSRIEDGPFTRVECVQPSASKPLVWGSSTGFSVRDGEVYVEGVYAQQSQMLLGVKARRPLSGRYAQPPPLFEIHLDQIPRDLSTGLVRFRFSGNAAAGRYNLIYQPEDDCSGGFCERRSVKEIDPASVSFWVTFGN